MGRVSSRLKKIIGDLKSQKIIDIDDLYEAKKKTENDLKAVNTPQQLGSDYHPSHAVYISTQNLVSVLAEKLTSLQEMNKLSIAVEQSHRANAFRLEK